MDWFSGSIAEAIAKAKAEKALFIVVIYGTGLPDPDGSEPDPSGDSDPLVKVLSSHLPALLQEGSLRAVSVKFESQSVSAKQFSALYPVVVVPCVYFIDSNDGTNLEATGGPQFNEDQLVKSVDKVKKAVSGTNSAAKTEAEPQAGPSGTASAQSTPQEDVAEAVASPRGIRVENAIQTLRENTGAVGAAAPADAAVPEDSTQSDTKELSLEERVHRAKKLLAEKQEKKKKEEENKERNDELCRREMGKQVQEMRRRQEDQALKEAAEERRRDREETRLAKERVRQQIEQDRRERAAKFNKVKEEEQRKKEEREVQRIQELNKSAEQEEAQRHTRARIQFRLPDGRGKTKIFEASEPLSVLYSHVRQEMDVPFSNFSLSTTFPTKLLDVQDMNSPLNSHGLTPSATVLILPKSGTGSSSTTGDGVGLFSFLYFLLTPVNWLWQFVQSFLGLQSQRPAVATSSASQSTRTNPPESSNRGRPEGYRSNVARLRDTSSDRDDDNNTWNGNSTQQQQ